ncbi:MAG TPA: hypothetical protein VGB38_08810 [bacterium]
MPIGGKTIGMGHAVMATAEGPESVFSNPAGLAFADGVSFTISFSRLYEIEDLDSWGAAGLVPWGRIRFGLGCRCFGNKVYRESAWHACISSVFIKQMAFGAQIRLLQLDILHYGSARTAVWDAGFSLRVNPRLNWGLSIFNVLDQTIGRRHEKLPRSFRTGIGWTPLSKCLCSLEFGKEGSFPVQMSAGIELAAASALKIRTGFQNNPLSVSFGFGLSWKNRTLDWGASVHPVLGVTQTLTLAFKP